MIRVNKQEFTKDIREERLAEFLAAGWTQEVQVADEVIRLKPAAKTLAKPAVKEEQGNDQTNIQGE
jgi:hypothetical protein